SPLSAALLPAVPPAEPARSGFWEYLSQLTSSKESPEQGQSGQLGRDNANPKESVRDGYVGNFLEKLAPLGRALQPQLPPDPGSLRELLGRELDGLRAQLSPHADRGRQLAALRSRLRPLTEQLLAQVSLAARELRRRLTPSREEAARLLRGPGEARRLLARRGEAVERHTERVRAALQPMAERLAAEIRRNVQELHSNAVPHPGPLRRRVQELSAKLTRSARRLHHHIQSNLERLKEQLSPDPARAPPASAQELSREVQRRLEQFRRDTQLQVRGFARALDREAEEMRVQLWCCPGEPPALHDLPARLDALWRELARSLGERGGEGL
ncbi:APOA5 protein, partial [Centropus bengalensis]|nr:APOA5 protein [Centropus bengalensis]